ncbi:MAG: ABC transporter permease [Anaerolineae bacterium]|nr:ABC transporter permease [Anaerolineae bacterium]
MKLLAIFWKDTLLRFSSRSELLFFLVLPMLFTLILAGGTNNQGMERLPVLVADQAQSPLSQQIVAELERSEAVRPVLVSLEQGEKDLKERQAAALLIIPPACDWETLQAGAVELELRQLPNDLNGQAAAQAVRAVLWRLGSAVTIAHQAVAAAEEARRFEAAAEREAYFDAALSSAQRLMAAAPSRLQVEPGAAAGSVPYDPAANSSAGQLITWVFIPLIGISALFAQERQAGTLRRLLVTPTPRGTFLLGTVVGNVFWALVQMALLVLFGVAVLKVRWADHPAALVTMLVSATLAAAALGVMLGAFVKTPAQANNLSIALGMVMALLGGCWYPIELFPEAVRTAVKVLPTTWAMQGMTDMLLRGQGLAGVLPEAAVLLGFASAFFAVGVWRFRHQ